MDAYDLRLDIGLRAVINCHLISLLERGGTLMEAKKKLFRAGMFSRMGIDEHKYSLVDQSLMASLLFNVFVVPREILQFPANHLAFKEFDAQNVPALFELVEPETIDSYKLIRCLRNAVSHALFLVSQPGHEIRYEFWNDNTPFRARIGQSNLVRFLDIVGIRLAQAVLDLRQRDV